MSSLTTLAAQAELTFADLGLAQPLLRAIADSGYSRPTQIQARAIPQVLTGADLMAAAQTGTGKTAGFTLPLLHRLAADERDVRPGRPRCLILTPTRELAAQVQESVQTYGKYLPLRSMVMFGGVGINPQIEALRRRVDILVATPGRLLDHAGQKTIDLSGVEILVLDEADRMLDMGFIHDIRRVLALLPAKRQNLLFSATFSDEIRTLADRLLHQPAYVEAERRNTASGQVEQSVHMVDQRVKREALAFLIRTQRWQQVLVFTRTKHGANKLAEYLLKQGISAAAIHGNKSQSARTRALADFKSNDICVLVATDIAARGLDIDQLPQVVNFELPNVPEDYVHRIGRTGRAGASGQAVSLVDAEEVKLLRAIENLIRKPVNRVPLDGFVPSAEGATAAPVPRGGPASAAGRGQSRGTPRGAQNSAPAKPAAAAPRQPATAAAGDRTRKPDNGRRAASPQGNGRRDERAADNRRPAAQPVQGQRRGAENDAAGRNAAAAPAPAPVRAVNTQHPQARKTEEQRPRAALFSARER